MRDQRVVVREALQAFAFTRGEAANGGARVDVCRAFGLVGLAGARPQAVRKAWRGAYTKRHRRRLIFYQGSTHIHVNSHLLCAADLPPKAYRQGFGFWVVALTRASCKALGNIFPRFSARRRMP
jgi:hypothetical protein